MTPPLLSRGDGLAGPPPVASLAPANPVVVVVGYPAPEAVRIVDRLLADGRAVACVVPPGGWPAAERRSRDARVTGRLRLYRGSAAEPGLGLPHTAWRLLDTADEMVCVASPADLALGHVQDFAAECPHLRQLRLVPTGARASGARWVRRLAGRLPSLRRSGRLMTAALAVGAGSAALAGAVASGVGALVAVVDLDVDAALSWEDVERDLWPGLPPAG